MNDVKNLLVELLVEELPPKALRALGDAFASKLQEGLQLNDFLEPGSEVTTFATPRRLAAHISHVRSDSQPRPLPPRTLMPVAVAYKDGSPTAALEKRIRSLYSEGVSIESLYRERRLFNVVEDGKDVVKHDPGLAAGSSLHVALEGFVLDAIAKLPIPKLMQYQLERGEGPDFQPGWTSVNFVRPAHGLVALHGSEVVPVRALGLTSGRTTQGHRFEAARPEITLQDADGYAQQLRDEGAVIAGFDARRAEIVRQLSEVAGREGLEPIDDDALLDEVTALVERPKVLLCRFEPEFLAVPQECLILTMKANQKYFPLLDGGGRLTERFLVVSNIDPADPSRVIGGNERVVRPRLADAKFFFDQDRKHTLESRVPQLAKVVYHGRLGTQGERSERVRAVARRLGEQLGGPALAAQADRAALLAKADLVTGMVGEFPELQGVMGGYYARHDGEHEAVALAVEDHYKPRFAGDALPRGEAGLVVALADKLETLAGLFGIGQRPSGDKDPFALRRHALGITRMLVERGLPLGLPALVSAAFHAFPAGHGQAQAEVMHFLYERLVGYLRELDAGYSAHEVDAVVALRPDHWATLPQRLAAVRAFAALPEAQALAAANKRVANILKKSEAAAQVALEPALLHERAEQALAAALAEVGPRADAAFARGDFTASLQTLAALRAPVDAFFDEVMVNVDDPALRANRLALLQALHAAMNRVADLARLVS
ncbi:MAG: glycine--tRNA ligase subunit beta [Rubrivivax sp. SCN 71-131]|mgnify:CR=1 FL=1|jgi:glycyl-tRNA synthetase beta chain|nr:MAG: glycine--tRNA ligase subunit beta [Rubrivivax sp. SCN 71-131]